MVKGRPTIKMGITMRELLIKDNGVEMECLHSIKPTSMRGNGRMEPFRGMGSCLDRGSCSFRAGSRMGSNMGRGGTSMRIRIILKGCILRMRSEVRGAIILLRGEF